MTPAQQASLRRFLAGFSAPDLPLVGASAQGLGPAFGSTPAVKLSGGKTGLLILVCEFKPLRPYQPRVTADAVLFNLAHGQIEAAHVLHRVRRVLACQLVGVQLIAESSLGIGDQTEGTDVEAVVAGGVVDGALTNGAADLSPPRPTCHRRIS
jgi:hypothetical protein